MQPPNPSTPGTIGIEGTGRRIVSNGAITGFGSILLNGVRYDVDRAQISVNGRAVTQSDLSLGQVVTVVGTLDSTGTTATADSVTYAAPLVGPVQSIDESQGTVVVLGQAVRIDGATRFAASVTPRSVAGLAPGTELEISGFRDSRGVLTARSVARRAAGQPLVATGDASGVDVAARRLTIGTLIVNYSTASLEGFGGRQPAGGDYVRAEGGSLDSTGVLQATRLALIDRRLPAQSGSTGHLQGWVTRFASVTDFDVDGYRVTTDGTTRFNSAEPAGFGGLRLDRFVNVVGVLLADGRLLATDIRTNNLFSINATVLAASPYAIEYGSTGRICETSATIYTVDGLSATWADLRPGDVATIAESFATNEPLRCHSVTVNRAVRGRVESIDAARGRLVIMGQTVHSTGQTILLDRVEPRSHDALQSLQPGNLVEVSGYRSSNGELAATRIALAAGNAPRQVTGAALALDPGARRFRIGSLLIDYSGATPTGFPAGGPASGQRVIVRGTQDGMSLRATQLEYEAPNPRGSANGPAHIYGPITSLTSNADFAIEGRRIVPAPASGTNQFPPLPCSEERIELDAFVTAITASQPVPGVDFARVLLWHAGFDVRSFAGSSVQLEARVDAIDVAQRTLRAAGLEVVVQPFTRLRQPGVSASACDAPWPLADVRVGDSVTAAATPGPGGLTLIADGVVRRSSLSSNMLSIFGRLSNYSPTELVVDGMRLRLSSTTQYYNCGSDDTDADVLAADEFGRLVQRELARAGGFVDVTVRAIPSGSLDSIESRALEICLASAGQNVTLAARVDAVDSAARTITLLGLTLTIDGSASIEDRTTSPASSGALSQLSAGQFVEIDARWRALGPVLLARRISILNRSGTGTAAISAVPDEWRAPDVIVLGRVLRTNGSTSFDLGGASISASEFFANRYLTYRFEVAPAADGTLLATRVEVGDE